MTDYGSQDATLLEVREQVLGEKTQESSRPKATQKYRRASQRGVLCVKSFCLRLNGPGRLSLLQLTHFIIPTWCGDTSVRRIFPSKRKGYGDSQISPDRKTSSKGPEMDV